MFTIEQLDCKHFPSGPQLEPLEIFYGVTNHATRSFSRMCMLEFRECQMNFCYPSILFQPSSSVVGMHLFGNIFHGMTWNICMLFLVNETPIATWTFLVIRIFLCSGSFMEWTHFSPRSTMLRVMQQPMGSSGINICINNVFHVPICHSPNLRPHRT